MLHVSPSSRITGHMSRFVYGCMWRVVCGYGTERIYRGKLHRKQLRESKGGSPGKSGLGQGEVAAAAARAHRHRLRRPNAAPHAAVGRRGRRRREAARSAARRTENEEAALARAAECVVLGLSVICLWLCRPCFRLFRHCLGSYFGSARGSARVFSAPLPPSAAPMWLPPPLPPGASASAFRRPASARRKAEGGGSASASATFRFRAPQPPPRDPPTHYSAVAARRALFSGSRVSGCPTGW